MVRGGKQEIAFPGCTAALQPFVNLLTGTMDFSLIDASHPLILASASPRRKALLKQVGLPFSAFRSRVREGRASGEPMETTCILAREKAQSVYDAGIRGWILGADTIVVIDHCILGKPQDKGDARRMLTALSGREHEVITGVSLLNPSGAEVFHRAVRSVVTVKKLTAVEINAYLATGEPFDKAGGYAIQGIAAFMIKGIRGSYTNIVGLPVYEVISALKDAGALGTFP